MKAYIFWMSFLLPASGVLAAETAAATRTSVWLGFSLLDFDYEEFFDDGSTADREEGYIPGVAAGAATVRDKWFAETVIGAWSGDVDYHGPVKSETSEDIVDWYALAGREIFRHDNAGLGLYGGFGYRNWERDIQSTPTTEGLFETYDWWYGLLGVRGEYRFNPATRLRAYFSLTRTIDPEIEVDFSGDYDDVTLDLGEKTGRRMSLVLERQVDNALCLWISPWYEVWKLGRSADKALRQGGVATGSIVFEPRSETENLGFNMGVTWRLQ
ncbi:MAG: hypothetical protein PVF08_07705 [Gammaproteobacteria bacterium]|jgi:hypothetical protein